MKLTLPMLFPFTVTLSVVLGTTVLAQEDYHNSRAAIAAREAIANPDTIEPYSHPRDYDPSKELVSKDPNHVGFWLYSDPNDPDKYDVIEFGNLPSLHSSSYDSAFPLKVLIHGFQSTGNYSFPQNAKNAYLSLRAETPYNVIAVDWGELATVNSESMGALYYKNVVENVVTVGTRVGEFIGWLKRNNFLDLKKVHVIGSSLGSHIAGVVGDTVKKAFGETLTRITALDPAGPKFYSGNLSRRITPEDADFVDALHTNAGILGLLKDVGQVDFYLNGGTQQPGCFSYGSFLTSVKGSATGLCSHLRAPQYWTKSILDGPSVKTCTCPTFLKYMTSSSCCESELTLGEHCVPGTKGTHYVKYVI